MPWEAPPASVALLATAALVIATGFQAGLVRPAAGATEEGPVESGSWNITLRNASTLRVAFEVEPSDPQPRFRALLHVGHDRTDNNRTVIGGVLWNDTAFRRGAWGYVNEDGAVVTVRADDDAVSQNITEGQPGYFNKTRAWGGPLIPEAAGPRYEFTLFADPAALMKVNITMPGGGTILDVDRDTGDATLGALPSFDSWTGARSNPGVAMAQFHEERTRDSPMVAVGHLGPPTPAVAGQQEVRTPEGCTGTQLGASIPGTRYQRSTFGCPGGAPEPIMRWSERGFYYRGDTAGRFAWNATFADSRGGAATWLATATFPE